LGRRISVEILGDASSAERAFAKTAAAAKAFKGSFSGLDRAEPHIRTIGRGLRNYVTLPVVAAGVASVKMGAQFENTLQKIVGLSGVSQRQVNAFRNEVLKLAPAVGKSPQELAEALYFITSSGIPASKAMGVLTVAAKASAAGLGETQVVADAVTSAVNAYGLKNLSAAAATDVLVATVREGKGEAADFAGVIGNVTALSSQLGVSFNDVGAALAAQTRLGTDAETSATQLQRVFTTLLKVTPQSEKAFEKVGLSAAGLRKELKEKGLLAFLETIKQRFKGNIPLLAQAFGDQRAIRGVLALVGNQSKQVEGIFNRMGRSAGSLNTAFGAVSNDTQMKFNRMVAQLQASAIQLGAALAPIVLKIASALKKLIDGFNRLPHSAKTGIGIIVGMLAVGGPLLMGFAALIRAVRTVRSLFLGLGPAATRGAAQAVIAEAAVGNGAVAAEAKVLGLRGALLSIGPAAAGLTGLGLLAADAFFLFKAFKSDQGKKVGTNTAGNDIVKAQNGLYYSRGAPGRVGGHVLFSGTLPDGTRVEKGKVVGRTFGFGGTPASALPDRSRLPRGVTTPAHEARQRVTVHTATGTKSLSLAGRFNLAELALANAGLTATESDDRRILKTEAAITREQLRHAKTLKDKVALTQKLGDILGRIRGIDQQSADREQQRLDALKEARSHFDTPLRLQLAEAKANALAGGKQEGLSPAQVAVEKKIKAAAMRALKSGKLAIQGQIDAWNTIAQANQALADQHKSGKSVYHAVSSRALTAGLNLNHAQRVELEQRIAQAQAHGGRVPGGRAANGIVINGDLNLHGVRNVDEFAEQLRRKARTTSSQTRGRHSGSRSGF